MRTIAGRVWGYRYVILAVVWLLYIINYFDRIAVLTFLPYIQKDLALTPVQVGQLASVLFFAYAIAKISAGYLADRIGPKKVMGLAIVVFTTVTELTRVRADVLAVHRAPHRARARGGPTLRPQGEGHQPVVPRRREGPGYLVLRHVGGGCAGHRARHPHGAVFAVPAREAAHRDPGAGSGRSRAEAPGRRDVSRAQGQGRATACEQRRD